MKRTVLRLSLLISVLVLALLAVAQQQENHTTNINPLAVLLQSKGILSPAEIAMINQTSSPEEANARLAQLLVKKGLISQREFASTVAPVNTATVADSSGVHLVNTVLHNPNTEAVSTSLPSPEPEPAPQASAAPQGVQQTPPAAPAVVAAIAPVRVLPVDPPVRDGLIPAFKMGPVKMTPYGFIKATAAHDSSAPNGDDFPFVGLFTANAAGTENTGPTKDPEFHIKARGSRFGANLEWPDASRKLTITGRVEADFEGNFSVADNRNVSTVRSNALGLRLAWVRMDYAASDSTDFYFEGGQDWTLFGSSALPNLLETTFLAAFYGDVYERSPQMMVGWVQKLGGSPHLKISPTFAIMMPTSAQTEKSASNAFTLTTFTGATNGLADQLGQGEREGADSDRPEYEGRLAIQWQLDKAPGVAPAQLIWSGFYAKRTSIVSSGSYETAALPAGCLVASVPASFAAPLENPLCTFYADALPHGYTATSKLWGDQLALQLPTRWFTLVASAYKGGDMRFMFGGQTNSFNTDVAGLSGPIKFETVDGLGNAAVACSVPVVSTVLANGGTGQTCSGSAVVAPERPIRSFGGFINLGLPLSRWFNANPQGHNAGWQLYLHAGKDQMVHRDISTETLTGSNALLMGKLVAASLYYKVNPWCMFGIEQSVYATRLKNNGHYLIAGSPSNEWQDHRTEFGPVFTF
ncbi:MAG: hypothetical protein ABSF66_08140 [Terriglobales bacterium]|jgi:hypothetical protein